MWRAQLRRISGWPPEKASAATNSRPSNPDPAAGQLFGSLEGEQRFWRRRELAGARTSITRAQPCSSQPNLAHRGPRGVIFGDGAPMPRSPGSRSPRPPLAEVWLGRSGASSAFLARGVKVAG